MKKTLIATAALLAFAVPGVSAVFAAEGEPGVEISGDARFRAVYRDNFDFGNHWDKNGNPVSYGRAQKYSDSRFRVQFKATTAGGAYAVGRLYVGDGRNENNDLDSGAGAPGGDDNVWVDRAYIMVPLGDDFQLQVGKYRVSYGTVFFYNDLPSGGVRAHIKAGDMVTINPFVEWLSEGQNELDSDKYWDHDAIRYGLHIGAQLNDNWRIGALAAYQSDDRSEDGFDAEGRRFSDHKGWLASVYFDGQEGPFGLKGEFSYNDGHLKGFNQWRDDNHSNRAQMNDGTDDDGYGGYIQPSYTWDALTLALNLGFTHGGFIAAPEYGFLLVGADHSISVMSVGEYGENWIWAGLTAKYAITDAVSITGNFAYAWVDSKGRDRGFDSLKHAMEISGVLDYAITKNLTFSWFAGLLIPSFEDPLMDDTAAFGSYGRFVISF